jgi:putative transposase
VGISRARFYRERQAQERTAPAPVLPSKAQRGSPRRLSEEERAELLALLLSERFVDASPRQVYAQLLQEGEYRCSYRTMYRLLHEHQAVCERRKIRRHPAYVKPELKATGPNQVWTWDITYLKTPIRGRFYYLYVVIDIYSRYVVGWMLADRECQHLAQQLLQETCRKYHIAPNQLTIHADRGGPMKSKPVEQLLLELQVTRSHSRPRVSNDNPYSEAGFKTMKYSPHFPERFATQEEAQTFCQVYFLWYNTQHHHTGLVLLTPEQVHFGQAAQVLVQRQVTLDAAYAAHPERFRERPRAGELPNVVWINAPALPVEAVAEAIAA